MFSWRFLIFLACVTSAYGFDGYKHARASSRADTCQIQGTQCSEDCTAVLFCSAPGATPIMTVNCSLNTDSNKFCFSNNGPLATCSDQSDCSEGVRIPFVCKEAGDFPDPFDCRSSYTCEADNPNPTQRCSCPSNSVWISNKNDCDTDPANVQGCCEDFKPDCSNNNIGGYFGVCPSTTSGFYYICDRAGGNVSISVHRCPDGQIFNPEIYSCTVVGRKKIENVYNHAKGISSTDKNNSKRRPNCYPISDSINRQDPTCKYVGEVIAVPNSCRGYWVCDENLKPIRRSCPEGFTLDCYIGGKCVCVACIDCCTGEE